MPETSATVITTCFICGERFRWGHDHYETGRAVSEWGSVFVCTGCGAHARETYADPRLTKKLEARGIRPIYIDQYTIRVP